MKFKIRFASQIVGIFVIIAALFLAVVLVLMGINQRWFAKNYYFKSRFPSATGLNVGMPITFKGFNIGKLTRISLTEENEVEIDFYIQDTFYPKVYESSILQLQVNPLGLGGGLVFHQGKNPTPPLPENSFIPSLDTPEGRRLVQSGQVEIPKTDDPITQLLREIEPILENVNTVLISVNTLIASTTDSIEGRGPGALAGTLRQSEKIAENIAVTTKSLSQSIETLLEDASKIASNISVITSNLEEGSELLKDPTGLVQKLLDPKGSLATFFDDNNRLYNQIEEILKGVNTNLTQLSEFTAFLNSTQPRILGALEEGREAIRKGQDVLEGLRNNPLLRGGIPPKQPIPTTQQGYRLEDF
ncbi:MAG TPA: MlaD family protein [Spirochaetales bacterium]|nr:MCE family protein [Spirochaetales bacterium]HOV37717.1 MlaD family protein [Spirochaetales bacterium]